MTDRERYKALVAEIERQKDETSIGLSEHENGIENGRMEVILALQEKVKRMQEESKEIVDKYLYGKEPELVDNEDLPKEEPISEDLEGAAKENAKIERPDDTEVGYDINRFGGFVDGANWQKQQDQSIIELAEDHAMLAGMEKMKEQMMKEAVDGTVFTQLEDGEIMVRSHYFKSEKFNYLDEVKLIIIKED